MDKTESLREFMQTILQTRASFKQAIQRGLRKHNIDITYEMLQVMACLWKHEGVNQQELADKTFKDKASLTYLINNLEKRELVVRQEDPNDRRNKLIMVTERGHVWQKKMQPLINKIHEFAAERIDMENIEDHITFLRKLDNEFKNIQ
jgi:Transcriptional regulators